MIVPLAHISIQASSALDACPLQMLAQDHNGDRTQACLDSEPTFHPGLPGVGLYLCPLSGPVKQLQVVQFGITYGDCQRFQNLS